MKWIFFLLGIILLISIASAEMTPFYPGPYGPGVIYKNNSWVDDMSTSVDHNVVSGTGAYNNNSRLTWNAGNGGLWNDSINYAGGVVYRNATFGSANYFMLSSSMGASLDERDITFCSQSPTDYTLSGNEYAAKFSGNKVMTLYIVVAGSSNSIANRNDLTATLGNTFYWENVYFNSTNTTTITFTVQSDPLKNLSSNDKVYTSGYAGFYYGYQFYKGQFDNFSIESPPGCGSGGICDGVNWTNLSGYPLDGIVPGATIVLNDTTTVRHAMPEHTSSCNLNPNCAHNQTGFQDANYWDIFNSTSVNKTYTTANITLTSATTGSMTGSYWVFERVNNTYGTNTTIKQNYINFIASQGGGAPTAALSCTPTAGVRNSSRTCTDQSTGSATSVQLYGAGTNPCSANNISFNVAGTVPIFPLNYSYCGVCEIASNANGASTACTRLYVSQPQTVI